MHTPSIIKLTAALAWAGVAVSSADAARAHVLTRQSGDYAACSNYYTTVLEGGNMCLDGFPYNQHIKFVTSACSAGGCGGDAATCYVENLYGEGRKATYYYWSCGERNYYGMDTCAC
jgi:hypothetical protein